MSDQVVPKVNVNGTSQPELERQCQEAWLKVQDALGALADMRPHDRDYQTSPEGDYQKARGQHENRVRLLERVKDEIMDVYTGVAEQRR